MRHIYSFFMRLFGLIMHIIAPFHTKSGLWVSGRKNWKHRLRKQMSGEQGYLWVHCSSLGEFEQGRPVIEALYENGEKVLLTFFSPSGYQHTARFNKAKIITYIPLDTATNASQFLDIVKPRAVLFVKYEFWFNFIREIRRREIPLYLISGIFRSDQYFFKPWGRWFGKQLKQFSAYFAQDELSATLARSLGIPEVMVSGDTRFDRVLKIFADSHHILELEFLKTEKDVMIAGSSWPEDEDLLLGCLKENKIKGRLILVPHDVNETRVRNLLQKCPDETVRLSGFNGAGHWRVMVVDRVGLLSRLYRYAGIAYIGGGFGRGIHNTLEAAVYGLPVIFGPNYQRFREAKELLSKGAAISVSSKAELEKALLILADDSHRFAVSQTSRNYVVSGGGATKMILQKLKDAGIMKS